MKLKFKIYEQYCSTHAVSFLCCHLHSQFHHHHQRTARMDGGIPATCVRHVQHGLHRHRHHAVRAAKELDLDGRQSEREGPLFKCFDPISACVCVSLSLLMAASGR